mmetsp:Transcript_19221/g.47507  ORF Transcript_19221/g.47507 Transcript_19221/m.47507 type:complete len:337 (-) Transcript_19221:104-1114(-)
MTYSTFRQDGTFLVIQFFLLESSYPVLGLPCEATGKLDWELDQIDNEQVFPCWLVESGTKVIYLLDHFCNNGAKSFLFNELLFLCTDLDLLGLSLLLRGGCSFCCGIGCFLFFQDIKSIHSESFRLGRSSHTRTPVFHGGFDETVGDILPSVLLGEPCVQIQESQYKDDNDSNIRLWSICENDTRTILVVVSILIKSHEIIFLALLKVSQHFIGACDFHKAIFGILMLGLIRVPGSRKSTVSLCDLFCGRTVCCPLSVIETQNLITIELSTEDVLWIIVASPICVSLGIKFVLNFRLFEYWFGWCLLLLRGRFGTNRNKYKKAESEAKDGSVQHDV